MSHSNPSTSLSPRVFSRILRGVVGIGLIGSIAACGNGGGGGSGGVAVGTGGAGGSAGQPGLLEFFQASLHAVDPTDPANVLTIDADAVEIADGINNVGALPFLAGTLQGGGIVDASIDSLVYARNDGTLQRVSTDGSAGNPVPEQVSSEVSALPLCDARVGFDLADSGNGRFVYGSDGNDCSGVLSWKSVRRADEATVDPVDFPGTPVEALFDPVDGSHTGWLTDNAGTLERLDANLTLQAGALSGIQIGIESLGHLANGTVFLEIDNSLVAFDSLNDRLIDLGFGFSQPCPCGATFTTDDQFGYFIDSGVLIRADAATASTLELDAPTDVSAFTFGFLPFLSVGTNRVAWSYPTDADGNPGTFDDQSLVVRSAAKDGTGAFDLDSSPLTLGPLGFLSTFQSANGGEWVFYGSQEALPGNTFQSTAVAARLDGTSTLRFPDSIWIGDSLSTGFIGNRAGVANRVIRLDGLVDLVNMGNNLLSLSSLAASDPTLPALDLGDLPSDAEFAFFLPGLGPARIGALVAIDGMGSGQSDVVFVDTETANSFTRLTATNGISEFPAPGF